MKLLNKLYSSALALLGFSACNPFTSITPDMYGTPVMYAPLREVEFRVEGTVTADKEPIEGIEITVRHIAEEAPFKALVTKTGVDGKYVVGWEYIEPGNLIMIVSDIDGEKNGGEFATQEIELSGVKAWTQESGSYFKVVTAVLDIELVKKTTEEENESE